MGGEARTPREHGHTHTQRTRGADPKGNRTGPRNAQSAWIGVPAGEGKGHPGGTTRNTHREGREGREEPKGRSKNRHRPRPPRTCRERRAHMTRALHPPRQ